MKHDRPYRADKISTAGGTVNGPGLSKNHIANFALFLVVLVGFAATTRADSVTPSVDDMTFNGKSADGYFLISGNDSLELINEISDDNGWGIGWAFLVKDDDKAVPTGSFNGLSFTLTVQDIGDKSGTWALTAIDTNGIGIPSDIGDYFDFVGVIKAGPSFTAYLFNDVKLLSSNYGEWKVSFVNPNNNKINGLSHLSLYIREGNTPDDDTVPAPEPGGLILLGSGLLGLAAWKFRKH